MACAGTIGCVCNALTTLRALLPADAPVRRIPLNINDTALLGGLDLGATMAARFPGACFGIKGVRARAGRASGGLISPVIKPQGSDADTLALVAYRCARAGADIVKQDHV